jgi:hypothetical protein
MTETVCNQGHDLTIPNALTSTYRCRLCWNEQQKLVMRARRGKSIDDPTRPYIRRKPRRSSPILELTKLVSNNEELAKYLLMVVKTEQWAKELETLLDEIDSPFMPS